MRKKLIAAIVVALILIGAAIGVIVFMENRESVDHADETTPATSAQETAAEETEAPLETTEETVGISLPTEDPNEVSPEWTLDPEDTTPPQTVNPEANQTEDPDENETPEMPL